MMAKFRVGDKARYVGDYFHETTVVYGHIGYEMTIISEIKFTKEGYAGYIVSCQCGSNHNALASSLEPILKRPELGLIEELSQILGGWKPGVSNLVREDINAD